MREAVLEGDPGFVIREAPEPVLGEGEVLIKVRYCGICGSDLHTYGDRIPTRYGHEYSGDIVETGPGVSGWEIGERVAAESIFGCRRCHWCLRGESSLCEEFDTMWAESTTGFATHTKAGADQLHRLPPRMSYEEGALVEPAAVALHAVRMSGIGVGDVVAVLGLGAIGQLAARLAKLSGARAVYTTEASRSRIDLAAGVVDEVIDVTAVDPVARILELTGGRGADIIFECAGAVSSTRQCLALAKKGGTIVIAGVCMHHVELPVGSIALRELTVKGSMCSVPDDFATALDLIGQKKLDVEPLITDVLPLARINEGFEKAMRGEGCKILIEP